MDEKYRKLPVSKFATGFDTHFGRIRVRRLSKTEVVCEFELFEKSFEEYGSDERDALMTLCDQLDTIAAEARANVSDWLRGKKMR